MKQIKVAAILSLAGILTLGCHFQQFHPAPLSPAETAASLETRSLNDSGLKTFIERSLGRSISWPVKVWDLRLLTLAAFYFNPQLQAARDQVAAAQAAKVTARMRPNPTLSFAPGVPSPYLIDLAFLAPVVTAGKRRYQIAVAQNLTEAARFQLARTAWTVRSAVRSALLDEIGAEETIRVLRAEVNQRRARLAHLQQVLAVGQIAKPIVTASQVNLLNAGLALRAAQGRHAEARAALAAAIGLPLSGLAGARFAWPHMGRLLDPASLKRIQREAVINRLDVRQALAEYRAAQSDLQLEIARQYPNVRIGPGYQYETDNFFSPQLSLTLPVFNKNQGPIAQAKAARKQAADHLIAVQAQVIAQTEQALSAYRAAYLGFKDAEQAVENLHQIQVPTAQRSLSEGESNWLSLNTVLLEESTAARVAVSNLFQAQAALGQLENAVERPLEPEDAVPSAFRAQ